LALNKEAFLKSGTEKELPDLTWYCCWIRQLISLEFNPPLLHNCTINLVGPPEILIAAPVCSNMLYFLYFTDKALHCATKSAQHVFSCRRAIPICAGKEWPPKALQNQNNVNGASRAMRMTMLLMGAASS
jgi:hypothetical protein